MNEQNTTKLFERYPQLFRGRTESISVNLMPFGFSCDDGWFELIDRLCATIDKIAQEKELAGKEYPKAFQVKQKFGQLCFNLDFGTVPDEIQEAITQAASESATICEICGKPGSIVDKPSGWVQALCESCLAVIRKNWDADHLADFSNKLD